jgi:hypothetical protein
MKMSKHSISHKIYQRFPQFPLGCENFAQLAAREKLSQPLDSKVNLQPLEEGSGRSPASWHRHLAGGNRVSNTKTLPSGKLTFNYGKITIFNGKSTINGHFQ